MVICGGLSLELFDFVEFDWRLGVNVVYSLHRRRKQLGGYWGFSGSGSPSDNI